MVEHYIPIPFEGVESLDELPQHVLELVVGLVVRPDVDDEEDAPRKIGVPFLPWVPVRVTVPYILHDIHRFVVLDQLTVPHVRYC